MVQFFPNTSKIFQVAAFKLFYSSLPLVAIRIIVGLILFLLFILAASSGSNKIFLKLIGDPSINFVLTRGDISTEDINKILASPIEKIPIEALFSESIAYSKKESQEYIDQFDILLALFKLNKGLANLEFQKELKENDLLNIVFWARR